LDIFFYFSKIFWLALNPGNVFFLLFSAAVLLLWLGKVIVARFFLTALVLAMSVVAFFSVGSWLLYPLESRFAINPILPKQVDGIIILSGGVGAESTVVKNQTQVNGQVDRELAFMRLARLYPNAKLLYTGGSSSLTQQRFKGADAARRMMMEQEFDVDRVLFERESRNTVESAVLSQKLLLPENGESWILITTAWHMPRSVGVFCVVGWPVIPYPVDYKTSKEGLFDINFSFANHLNDLDVGIKEWLGLVVYRITGRTNKIIPSACSWGEM